MNISDVAEEIRMADDVANVVYGDCGIDDGLDDGRYLMYQSFDIDFKDGDKVCLTCYYVDGERLVTDIRELDR